MQPNAPQKGKVLGPEMSGVLEGQFAIPIVEMISRLNKLLAMEYNSWLTYMHYSQMVRGPYREQLSEIFLEHADEELKHVRALSLRIAVLGGVTSTDTGKVPPATKIEDMIPILIRQEQEALKEYRKVLRLVGHNEGLRQVLETIVEVEQEHTDELWLLLPGGPVNAVQVITSRLEEIALAAPLSKTASTKFVQFLDDLEQALSASLDNQEANVKGSPYVVRVAHDDGVKCIFQIAKFEDHKEPESSYSIVRLRKAGKVTWSCDCPGAKQWGNCKHIPMVIKWDKAGRKVHPAFASLGVSFKTLLDDIRKHTESPLDHSHKEHPKRQNVNPKLVTPRQIDKPQLVKPQPAKQQPVLVTGPIKKVKGPKFRLKKT